jgi:uncharacterized protein involved in cysteine biosynthesis
MVKPDVRLIFIGGIILLIIYFIPISGGTLAKNAEVCSSGFTSLFFGCNSFLFWIFYIGWVFAVLIVLLGIFNKKAQ